MSLQLRSALLVIVALAVVATGVLLTRSGRPYGTAILTVHKLTDLAAIILVAIVVIAGLRGGGVASLDLALAVVTLILSVGILATGGVLSASETAPSLVTFAHRWLSWPLIGLLGLVFYRFVRG